MRIYFFTLIIYVCCSVSCYAQNGSTNFKGYFYNEEYNVYLHLDLYGKDIAVPNHSMFGNLPGYLGKKLNNFYWLITSGKIKKDNHAIINMINDYGSEDLKASLKRKNDSIYIFKQEEGSPLKVANNGKWLKLPKEFILKKKQNK